MIGIGRARIDRRHRQQTGGVIDAGRWFEALAAHAGRAYLRYSFTRGSEQEVGFLVSALDLQPGAKVLDVGCGPGRHLGPLAQAGMVAVGADISARFVCLAAGAGHPVLRADGRCLPLPDGSVDAAISLCQGGFGLAGLAFDPSAPGGTGDGAVLAEMARVVRPGGRVAVSAFSSYFAVRFLEATDTFDAGTGINHERTRVKDEAGEEAEFELWTTCFTPRELRLLAGQAGLVVEALWSVSPGDYAARPPDLDHPEWLLVGSTIAR
jgi:SAM-dependent methyltransferase